MAVVEMRNRFKVGDELEVLSPTNSFNKRFIVSEIYDENNNQKNKIMKPQIENQK